MKGVSIVFHYALHQFDPLASPVPASGLLSRFICPHVVLRAPYIFFRSHLVYPPLMHSYLFFHPAYGLRCNLFVRLFATHIRYIPPLNTSSSLKHGPRIPARAPFRRVCSLLNFFLLPLLY